MSWLDAVRRLRDERAPGALVTVVDVPAPWRVRRLNCIAHLDGLAAPPAETGAV